MFYVPTHRRIITDHVTRQVTYIHKVIVLKPSNVSYPPLKNASDACHGAPVEIIKMEINGAQDDDKNSFTWMTVRPLGDTYNVACVVNGDNSDLMSVGDVVALPQGREAGGN
jgi:hypothetical protein